MRVTAVSVTSWTDRAATNQGAMWRRSLVDTCRRGARATPDLRVCEARGLLLVRLSLAMIVSLTRAWTQLRRAPGTYEQLVSAAVGGTDIAVRRFDISVRPGRGVVDAACRSACPSSSGTLFLMPQKSSAAIRTKMCVA